MNKMQTGSLQRRKTLLTFFISLMFLALVATNWHMHYSAGIRYFNLAFFSAGGLVWLIVYARSGRPLRIPVFMLPLGLLIGYLSLLVMKSPVFLSGLEAALTAIFYTLCFLFFLHSLQGSWTMDTWEKALIATAIMFCIHDLISLLFWLMSWWNLNDSLLSLPPVGYRIKGSFLNSANIMAGYINLVLPLVIVRLISAKVTSRKAVWGLIALLFVILEYFASSRGAWISAIVGVGMTLILLQIENLRKYLSIRKMKELILSRRTILAIVTFLVLGGLLFSLFARQIQQTPGHSPGGSGRMRIWTHAFHVFQRSPLLGNGPASMRVFYAIESGVPPGFAADHAHNLPLQIAAEFGLVGFVLVLITGALIVKAFFQAWSNAKKANRFRIAALAGSLLALSTHHLVDYLFQAYPYAIATLLLLALLSHLTQNQQTIRIRRNLTILLICVLLASYCLGFLYVLRGMSSFESGIYAGIFNDWKRARNSICSAYEGNKNNSYYAFQCAIVSAEITFFYDDRTALEPALLALNTGLEIDPYWPTNWANLAALEWEHGDRQQAVAHMDQALTAAPRNWIFALNLGRMEEELEQEKDALNHYKHALSLNPLLEISRFFKSSIVRQQALATYQPPENPSSSDEYALTGWVLWNNGNISKAKETLNHAIHLDTYNGVAYALLSQIYLAEGLLEEAWETIKLGSFVEFDSPIVLTTASEIAREMGNEEDAMNYLYFAYYNFQRLHQSRRYYGGLYKRGSLPRDLVPQLVQGVVSDGMLEDFTELAEHLEMVGNTDESEAIFRWVEEEKRR